MILHDLFTTPVAPGDNQEWQRMIQREAAILDFEQGLIQGTLSGGEIEQFADNLAEHDIEPYGYLDCVFDNIRFVIQQGILLEL